MRRPVDKWEIRIEHAEGLSARAANGGFDIKPFDGVRVLFRKAGVRGRWRSFTIVSPIPKGALAARSLQKTVTRFVDGKLRRA